MALLRSQGDKALLGRYSSFNTVEKTLGNVVELLLKNERLKRLLYYSDRKALRLPKLTQEQTYSLLNTSIKIVPQVGIDDDVKSYVILTLDNFVPEENQTTFRRFQLQVDILCNYEYWNLEDFKLRPYAIAGEVDALINNSFITGVGVADFVGAKSLVTEDMGGLTLCYIVEAFTDDVKLHPDND